MGRLGDASDRPRREPRPKSTFQFAPSDDEASDDDEPAKTTPGEATTCCAVFHGGHVLACFVSIIERIVALV